MTLFAEDIVEPDGTRLELGVLDAELRQALLDEAGKLSYLRNTAQVSLHVCHEARDAGLANFSL